MTERERAIVMAYTGICMLAEDRIKEFYKYLDELYGRPVYTHELLYLDIKEKAKNDFADLCKSKESQTEEGQKIPDVQEYIELMRAAAKKSNEDEERGHTMADGILCDFLTELGYEDLVKEWDNVKKWYA